MRYLLDANAVIGLWRNHPRLIPRVHRRAPQDFGLPVIVLHELFYGAYHGSRHTENVARVEALRFEVLPFDQEDAREAGEIRAALAAAGTPIGPYDVLIAGQARCRGLTLITHNVTEFARVSGLRMEDWET